MPGYWRQPDMTAKAFDEEGFYKMGDALKPVDPDNFDAGFDFDGRTGEDFKLASGTWVSVGPLRARFVAPARRWCVTSSLPASTATKYRRWWCSTSTAAA